MLNAFTFAGGEVGYGSRFLQTEAYRDATENGEFRAIGFAQDPCRSLFKRVTAMFSPTLNDNTNVNLVRLGERYLAMTELPLPVEFDPETLETNGLLRWKDRLGGPVSTAHPHHDPGSDGLINYVTKMGARTAYQVYSVPAGSNSRKLIASLPVSEPGYMHSFALTERHIVLTEYPLLADPKSFILKGGGFIDHFDWKPDRGTRFIVFDRDSGDLRGIYEGEAFFSFHHINAFEEGDDLVIDLSGFDDPSLISLLEVEKLRGPDPVTVMGEYRRYRVPLNGGGGGVSGERLIEPTIDLPRTNYGRVNGRAYRYAWGVGEWLDQLVKADSHSGEARTWSEDGCFPGEPIFVPHPDGGEEDAGIILSVVLDSRREASFLLILDAAGFEEIARAEAPQMIPFGFHGDFF
jgi:beta,beta-carotene 9',10'-dioxygenase